MSTVSRIQFTATINATPAVVWYHITSPDSYKHWTSAFAEGSYFEGAWDTGSKIYFLSPSGDGMVSEIAESRMNEFISIRHLGFLSNGTEDTTSDSVLSWAPAYENYTLLQVPEGTRLVVDQDVPPEWEEHMNQAWPKAIDLLKKLSESTSAA
ncbi:MAG: SRPBCC domain-containing protein [Rhodocyclaceae bacterium]|nr:SRPBCC domain-containing protein [Rhodocyclaceae bacterium]